MRASTTPAELTLAQRRDEFRGRCALALVACARITQELAQAIRVSPMAAVDYGALDACRRELDRLAKCLDSAQESVRAVRAAEERETPVAPYEPTSETGVAP